MEQTQNVDIFWRFRMTKSWLGRRNEMVSAGLRHTGVVSGSAKTKGEEGYVLPPPEESRETR